jgi:hypothetical protein
VLHTPQEFVDHPQTQARGFFASTGWEGVGEAPFATLPITSHHARPETRAPGPDTDDSASAATHLGRAVARCGCTGLRSRVSVWSGSAPPWCPSCAVPQRAQGNDRSGRSPPTCCVRPAVSTSTAASVQRRVRGRRRGPRSRTDGGRPRARPVPQADVVAENHRGRARQAGVGRRRRAGAQPIRHLVSSRATARRAVREIRHTDANAGSPASTCWNHAEAPFRVASLNHPDHRGSRGVAVLAAIDLRPHRRGHPTGPDRSGVPRGRGLPAHRATAAMLPRRQPRDESC